MIAHTPAEQRRDRRGIVDAWVDLRPGTVRQHGPGQGIRSGAARPAGRRYRGPRRSTGQYVANAPPMIHSSGTGPQKRESSEAPRLSPIMK